jgi:LacI family transcriptional regulator, kdg operon repressor
VISKKAQYNYIPKDVSVIGVDEVPFADFYTPAIKTIKHRTVEMANLAAELLLSKSKVRRKMKPTLIFRNSC